MVICLERGADLYVAQLMPLLLTVSCFSKIQVGFTFLVPAHLGSPGQRAVKRVCVSIACSLSNISAENRQNHLKCVEVIASQSSVILWVGDTVYIWLTALISLQCFETVCCAAAIPFSLSSYRQRTSSQRTIPD